MRELAVDIGGGSSADKRSTLEKCAQTSLNSKLVRRRAGWVLLLLPLLKHATRTLGCKFWPGNASWGCPLGR